MKKTVFLYSGEGTKNIDSQNNQNNLIRKSKRWNEIRKLIHTELNLDLDDIWNQNTGHHKCPESPLITLITQICLSDIWKTWGIKPDINLGHSTGELAASYEAGLYTLKDILLIAWQIGNLASRLEGVMVHGSLSLSEIEKLPVYISSYNFKDGDKTHITLSGNHEEIHAFLKNHPEFVKMRLPHPWHHPDYQTFHLDLTPLESGKADPHSFVSGVTAKFERNLPPEHWNTWTTSPVDFITSMEAIKNQFPDDQFEVIEIGFHPVLSKCCEIFESYTYASSMFRGENETEWILHQRHQLNQEPVLKVIKRALDVFKPGLDYHTSLAFQGLTSQDFVELSLVLEPVFPGLSPQDFYRYKTIDSLIHLYGSTSREQQDLLPSHTKFQKNQAVISGMSCKLPASIESLSQFWKVLQSRDDQVKGNPVRGDYEAGFLNDHITRFDHQYFGIPDAEARTMDPQQILALELTELLFKDAGINPDLLDKNRVGVYLGVWNEEYQGEKDSVFYPSGTNPSIIASRISYQYDFRGPSWVTNTACSSSLIALHYAARDIEDGRVDYAIAGGVNMLLGNSFTHTMKDSGFLSSDQRCKTFDGSANGYVRAEGGGLVLLTGKHLTDRYYAELSGSSVNQNGGRSQNITAPHPEAQEDLIRDACRDAGIRPHEIDYLECHGTGTKIGDPIEISAIQNTVAKDRDRDLFLGSVKSNLGHLESAAGIAGLIKSVLILNQGVIPPNLHFDVPNPYIDFHSHHLKVVSRETEINKDTYIGISSFGFGGVNAHAIIKGASDPVRKKLEPVELPFDRNRSNPLTDYFTLENDSPENIQAPLSVVNQDTNTEQFIRNLFYQITGIDEIDPDIELIEQGLESVGALEFITKLEQEFQVSLDDDFLFDYGLIGQIVDQITEGLNNRETAE